MPAYQTNLIRTRSRSVTRQPRICGAKSNERNVSVLNLRDVPDEPLVLSTAVRHGLHGMVYCGADLLFRVECELCVTGTKYLSGKAVPAPGVEEEHEVALSGLRILCLEEGNLAARRDEWGGGVRCQHGECSGSSLCDQPEHRADPCCLGRVEAYAILAYRQRPYTPLLRLYPISIRSTSGQNGLGQIVA